MFHNIHDDIGTFKHPALRDISECSLRNFDILTDYEILSYVSIYKVFD